MEKRLLLILLAVFGLTGCGVVSPLINGNTPTGTTSGGELYVSTDASILRYGNALSTTGNVAPTVTISGTSSQLNSPKRIFLDVTTDRLFVANQGGSSVLIFSPASTATAGSTPSAVITSPGNLVSPVDIAIDAGRNLLYVADASNNTIFVFTGESAFSGNVATTPAQSLTVSFNIAAIFLDATNNNLFIADQVDNIVAILPSVSQLSGQVTTLAGQLTGATTTLTAPNGVTLDSNGRVIVSNGGSTPSILVFTNAVVPLGGDPSPLATISGSSTDVLAPGQIVFNSSQNNGELYVLDAQDPGILIFTNINSASGSITSAPTRSIIGSGTGLGAGAVNGLALDTTR